MLCSTSIPTDYLEAIGTPKRRKETTGVLCNAIPSRAINCSRQDASVKDFFCHVSYSRRDTICCKLSADSPCVWIRSLSTCSTCAQCLYETAPSGLTSRGDDRAFQAMCLTDRFGSKGPAHWSGLESGRDVDIYQDASLVYQSFVRTVCTAQVWGRLASLGLRAANLVEHSRQYPHPGLEC